MDLTITSTRTCASMPGHQLCLDYTLPAVKKIFARFLTQHPRIPDYKNCHYHYNPSSSGPISTITCSSGSYTIEAVHEKLSYVPESLSIKLSENAGGFERLFCDKDGCQAENDRANDYLFFRLYGINRCSECFNHNIPNRVPCDGPVSKFDDYLQHATVALDPVQPASPPSNPPNSPPNAWSPPSQPTSFFPNPPPPFNFGSPPPPPIFSFGNPPSQNTAFSSNPTPQ